MSEIWWSMLTHVPILESVDVCNVCSSQHHFFDLKPFYRYHWSGNDISLSNFKFECREIRVNGMKLKKKKVEKVKENRMELKGNMWF